MRGMPLVHPRFGLQRKRQVHNEGRALALARTGGSNRSPVKFCKLLRYGETQAQATVSAARRTVLLREAVEEVGQEAGRDADTRVAHHEFDVRVHASQQHLDLPSRGRELDGVAEE